MTQLERYVELTEYANKLATERDALAAELAGLSKDYGALLKEHDAKEARVDALEAALREIACGLMPVDSAADHRNRYELCAGRLCKIARDALEAK